jgi:hypothetical protein
VAKVQRFWKAWWVALVLPAYAVAAMVVAGVFDINHLLAAIFVGIVVGTVLRVLRRTKPGEPSPEAEPSELAH